MRRKNALYDLTEFLRWEAATRDTIDFKTIYVDMAEDLHAGLLLSQIVYWHLGDKLRVEKNGKLWIAKAHAAWWSEVRLTAMQARRALEILKRKGLIEVSIRRFDGSPTTHIRINPPVFLNRWNCCLEQMELFQRTDGNVPENRTITENTTEITAENTTISGQSFSQVFIEVLGVLVGRQMQADEMNAYMDEIPHPWFRDACKIALDNNVRTWAYVRAILERWKREGKTDYAARKQSQPEDTGGTDYNAVVERDGF